MRSIRLILLVLCAAAAAAVSAAPRLIPIADGAVIVDRSSNPGAFFRGGSLLYFAATDETNGREVWRTDGTTAGTTLLRDLRPGVAGSNPILGAAIGTSFIFVADDGAGPAIWRTDGTSTGTARLAALARGGGSAVRIIGTGSRVFVLDSADFGAAGLWVTDGTAQGTHLAGAFPVSGDRDIAGVNGLLFFTGSSPDIGAQLWVSDGTAAGTHVARRGLECTASTCAPVPNRLFALGNVVLVLTETELWRSDGTPAGTVFVQAIRQGALLAASDRIAFLRTTDGTVWRTDGTTAGTTKTAIAGTSTEMLSPRVLDDGRLLWVTRRGSQAEVRVSDGTADGTRLIGTARAQIAALDPVVAVNGSKVYLGLSDRTELGAVIHGSELWLEDVQAESLSLLADIDDRLFVNGPASGNPRGGTALGAQVVFTAMNFRGTEPWITDGTTAGTRLLRNIMGEGPAGAISGTVRDAATGAPIAGATVQLCSPRCEEFVLTDAAGNYRLEPLQPQKINLQAGSSAYLLQSYDHGAQLTIVDGMELTGVDFQLVRGGSISGRVTHLQGGAPIQDAQVLLVPTGGGQTLSAGTSTSGRYRFEGLSSGTYYVYTGQLFAPVVGQVYRNRDCQPCVPSAGDPVQVTVGTETAGIDFALHDYGRISGTVRDTSTGAPIAKASVSFRVPGDTSTPPFVNTDDQGRYTSPLLFPRAYVVSASLTGYTTAQYPAVPCPSACDPSAGTPVTVPADSTIRGIDLGIAPSQARLTGTLRGSDGKPIPDARMSLYDAKGLFISSLGDVQTDAAGRFTFPTVAPGTYYLKAVGELYGGVECNLSPCNVAGATPIVLTAGRTSIVDMTSRARYFRITGHLYDAQTGRPIGGISDVQLSGPALELKFGSSGGAGSYDIAIASRATSVQVSASVSGYHPKTHSGTFTGSADGVDLFLDPFGSISGTVYSAANGRPLANVNVQFLSADGKMSTGFTDMNGQFRATATGTYRGWIEAAGAFGGQVYRDHDCGTARCAPAAGDPIVVADGVTVAGIDFHLQTVHPSVIQFSGRVVDDETGAPMAGVIVSLGSTTTSTDADGRYVLAVDQFHEIAPGDYRLSASAQSPAYYVAWSGGGYCATSPTPCAEAGPAMTVAAGASPIVNFRMVRLHLLGITPAAGPLAGGTRVVLTGDRFPASPAVQFNGIAAMIVSATPTQIVALTPAAATAGPVHVKVTDTKSGLSVTRLHAFTYGAEPPAPLPAATLSVLAPASAATNVPFAVTVTALDSNGDLASGYRGTVTVTSSAVGSLPAPYTFTADDSGRHTFTVSLTSFGAQTLTLTDGTLTTTRAIAVSCAAATSSAMTLPLPSSPAAVCGGSTGNTASIAPVPGSAYAWSIANGTITSGQATNAIAYTAGAGGNVTLTLAMANASTGCTVTTYTASVPIRPQPVATIPAFLEGCSGMPLTVPISLSGTAPFHLVWSDGVEQNGLAAAGASRTLTAPVPGTIGIVSVDDASCSSAAGSTATVSVNVSPQIVSTATDVSVRSGDSARLVAATEPHAILVSYRWYEGEAGDESHPVGSDSPAFDTPPVRTTLRYWVRATNPCGSTVRQFTARVTMPTGRRRGGS